MKLKAGTLFFVLLISLLIGIIMTTLIMYAFYVRQKNNDDLSYLKLQRNVESTFTYLRSGDFIAVQDTSYQLDLYGQEQDSVSISLRPWGVFQVASVTAFHRARNVQKSGFIGYLPPDSNAAIYLSNKKRDFTLSGNSRIYGNAILPAKYINRGNAEGRFYSGDKMIYSGEIKQSIENKFPLPDEEILENIRSKIANLTVLMRQSDILRSDSVYACSFESSTLYLKPYSTRLPSHINLSGNIILSSDTLIVIPGDCHLQDIIIVAPAVVFEDGFSGSVQVFATDSIIAGNNYRFTYPSVLGLFKSSFSIQTPSVKTGKQGRFEGIIFSIHDVQDLNGSFISLGEKSRCTGLLYSQGTIEIKPGTKIEGSVIADEFLLKTANSIYANNLLDVVINNQMLPEYFAGTILPPPTSRLTIVKWFP